MRTIGSDSHSTDQSIMWAPISLEFSAFATMVIPPRWIADSDTTTSTSFEDGGIILGDIRISDIFGELENLVDEIRHLTPLRRSSEFVELIERVIGDVPNRDQDDIERWARELASDVAETDD